MGCFLHPKPVSFAGRQKPAKLVAQSKSESGHKVDQFSTDVNRTILPEIA